LKRKDNFKSLYQAFIEGNYTRVMLDALFLHFKTTDEQELRTIIKEELQKEEHIEEVNPEESLILKKMHAYINTHIEETEKSEMTKSVSRTKWTRILAVAASILIIFSVGQFFRTKRSSIILPTVSTNYKNDVAPGGNKATLTLADGRKITLTDAKNGELAKQAGIIITKTKEGILVYTAISAKNSEVAYNKIQTPRGGQYQINLPDGSKVWLNADASLRYPTIFNGHERKVELTGEAYFEIAPRKSMPFKVLTDKQEVEVFGTHFNISSYIEDLSIKTTLIEGSVKVSNIKTQTTTFLKPNQQSILTNNALEIITVDADESIAWKNGEFVFNDEKLETIMNSVARWYDVEIKYQNNNIRKKVFNGTISRFGNVSKVLRMLELTGQVTFKIEGRKITINA
jgi:transmembrane sensor